MNIDIRKLMYYIVQNLLVLVRLLPSGWICLCTLLFVGILKLLEISMVHRTADMHHFLLPMKQVWVHGNRNSLTVNNFQEFMQNKQMILSFQWTRSNTHSIHMLVLMKQVWLCGNEIKNSDITGCPREFAIFFYLACYRD